MAQQRLLLLEALECQLPQPVQLLQLAQRDQELLLLLGDLGDLVAPEVPEGSLPHRVQREQP